MYEGGSNGVSLAAARRNYFEFGACNREFVSNVRPPETTEIPLFVSSADAETYHCFERGIKDAVVVVARSILSGHTGAMDGCRAIGGERGTRTPAWVLVENLEAGMSIAEGG